MKQKALKQHSKIKVSAPSCNEAEENENLCDPLTEPGLYNEYKFNDDIYNGQVSIVTVLACLRKSHGSPL